MIRRKSLGRQGIDILKRVCTWQDLVPLAPNKIP